jgi:hypothetical protein
VNPEPPLRVAVMQPYFFPYAGYYRLLAAADLFLLYDCVQFKRGGRIHRCELAASNGQPGWLTLPLTPAPRATPIDQIRLAPQARRQFDERLRRWPWVASAAGPNAELVRSWLAAPLDGRLLVDYLEYTLRGTAALLGLPARFARASTLALAPELRGEQRVIATVRAVGGGHFINPPGGIALYDADAFRAAGLQLSFLTPYQGRFPHMLPALMQCPAKEIADDIWQTTELVAATPGGST